IRRFFRRRFSRPLLGSSNNHSLEGERKMISTMDIGKKLVELCNKGNAKEAMETLYGPKIVSVEAHGGPSFPQRMEGITAVKGKAEWWEKNHEVHSGSAEGPWPHGDRFIVR